jgi:hypothetical protein
MGQQPRKFDATRAQLLANCSELLVRQLERKWALKMMESQVRLPARGGVLCEHFMAAGAPHCGPKPMGLNLTP